MTCQPMAQHIELWPIEKLIPYARNLWTHSDAQTAQRAGNIVQSGFNSSILIDSKRNIIAGYGRYLAALTLGLETVPVIVLDHLSEILLQSCATPSAGSGTTDRQRSTAARRKAS
jgi:ParB-like chromosome segregation protein Spo0J